MNWRDTASAVIGMGLTTALISGCVVVTSREPLYDARRDRIFDKKLVGMWRDERGACLNIEADGEGGYYVIVDGDRREEPRQPAGALACVGECSQQEGGSALHFDLVRLDGVRYLFLKEAPGNAAEMTGGNQPPRHSMPWARVQRSWDRLHLRALDGQALHRMLEEHHALSFEFTTRQVGTVAISKIDGEPVGTVPVEVGSLHLADSAQRIRAFLKQHSNDDDLWTEPATFWRVRQ